MVAQVRKSVIPVAGWGTRFLPATKSVPKALLPVVDTPAVEYVVAEAAAAGLSDVVFVISPEQQSVVEYFQESPALEEALQAKGDAARLDLVRRPVELAKIHVTQQKEPLGLGHAVLCAQSYVGEESFVVQLGDDLIDERDLLLKEMLSVHAQYGGVVLALQEVPLEHTNRYGVVAIDSTVDFAGDRLVAVSGVVEKPAPAEAPSNLAIIGRYVLPPEVFDAIRLVEPGAGGEIQLTDAIGHLLSQGMPIHGVVFEGRRYDIGDRGDYLKAVVRLAVERKDLGPEFRAWLVEFVHKDIQKQ